MLVPTVALILDVWTNKLMPKTADDTIFLKPRFHTMWFGRMRAIHFENRERATGRTVTSKIVARSRRSTLRWLLVPTDSQTHAQPTT